MIKTKISAVTSVTYGLLSALIIAVIVGGLSAAGVGVENVFSAAGNGIAATAGTSTPTLTAEQQSEIANAAAEIAAGTASAACLQYMNNSANAASMVSSNATCLGPGLNIAPPQQPIKMFSALENTPVFTYPDGQIYAISESGDKCPAILNSQGLWFYNDGFVMNGYGWRACSSPNSYSPYYSSSTVMASQGTSISCTGGVNTGDVANVVNNTNVSQSAPLGYVATDTW